MIQASENKNQDGGRGSKVLIVEDDVSLLKLLKRLLEREGFLVTGCPKPSEALPLLARDEFEVVVMDLTLPEYDGLELFEKIKEMNLRANVIINTANASLDSAKRSVRLGAFSYIEKLKNKPGDLIQEVHRAARDHLRTYTEELEKVIEERTRAFQASEERFRDLFEVSQDPILLLAPDGRIEKTNAAASQLLQHSPEELLTLYLHDLLVLESEARRFQSLIDAGHSANNVEVKFRKKDGTEGSCLISMTARQDRQGDLREYQVILRDITQRIRLEQLILNISEHEKERFGQELHDDLGQLLTGLSYHFPVIGRKVESGKPVSREELSRFEGMIRESIQKAKSLAQGLYPVELKSRGLSAALEELVVNVSTLFEREIEFHRMDEVPHLDFTTSVHLFRVVQEALTNAIKHSGANKITMELEGEPNEITLSVRDDGQGMPFDPSTGSGLGLQIMQHRANVIHAELEIVSGRGKGTEVICRLNTTQNLERESRVGGDLESQLA